MLKSILIIGVILFSISCSNNKATKENVEASSNDSLSLITVVPFNDSSATIEMDKYFLVKHKNENLEAAANEVMYVKRRWPQAMQSLDRNEFESILSEEFTFVGGGQLLNREEYIQHRTTPSEWKITHVQYHDLTLQFFGEKALLSYRNVVTNENMNNGDVEVEKISWSDVFVKENDQWKIGGTHVIDYALEAIAKK